MHASIITHALLQQFCTTNSARASSRMRFCSSFARPLQRDHHHACASVAVLRDCFSATIITHALLQQFTLQLSFELLC
jgi:hypothetical protein